MDEWVFNQVVLNRKRLREALPDLFDSIEFGKRITDLPLDVLALVLSYISLSDVRNCWMVNKQFMEAITNKPHFWKRFINQHLEKAQKYWRILKDVKHLFNNFNSPIPETLKEQMTFLFMKDIRAWMDVYNSAKGSVLSIDRRSNGGRVFTTEIRLEDYFYFGIGTYESTYPRFDFNEGELFYIRLTTNIKYIYIKDILKKAFGIEHSSKELTWEGDVLKKENRIIAHGSGKWISKDGTVFLEGENVAENGEPVFKLKYEDYKKVKHLITN